MYRSNKGLGQKVLDSECTICEDRKEGNVCTAQLLWQGTSAEHICCRWQGMYKGWMVVTEKIMHGVFSFSRRDPRSRKGGGGYRGHA